MRSVAVILGIRNVRVARSLFTSSIEDGFSQFVEAAGIRSHVQVVNGDLLRVSQELL